jgi:hypothetical protein
MKHSQYTHVGRWRLATAALFLTMLAQPAWAYLDPGTGSMIISAVVGLLATVGLAVKTYWYKIKAFFRKDTTDLPTGDSTPMDAENPADH